jgi:hypothetical protein
MDECIHGFEPGMCASCFPPPEPEKVAVKRPPKAPKTQLRTPTPGSTAAKAPEPRANNLPKRIFHVTHVRNLPTIIASGELRPSNLAAAEAEVVLASEITHELRATAQATPDETVLDCIAFSLSPQAVWWSAVQDGAAGPTWSDDARRALAVDFIVLGVDITAVADRLIVTDGDAAAMTTAVGSTPDAAKRMLSRAAVDENVMQAAEALVPGTVPLESVVLVAVANDKRRDEVKAALTAAGLKAKVAVYPPWFVPAPIE